MKRLFCILIAVILCLFTASLAEPVRGGKGGGTMHGYTRIEEAHLSGGTIVSVYDGIMDSNSVDPYLEAPGDYLTSSVFKTKGGIVSTSNITASTNYTETWPGTVEGYGTFVRGGVQGVSWENDTNTLILENASGTVIDIAGPELHVDQLNTYNDKLQTIIDVDAHGLVSYVQSDVFGGSPHTKTNVLEQDVVHIRLIGENRFDEIHLSGHVRVVFEGEGKLTLENTETWSYDQPGFESVSAPTGVAIVSTMVVGYGGALSGVESVTETMPNGMERSIEESFVYAVPEIVLADGMAIVEGGTTYNSAMTSNGWVSFIGTEDHVSTRVILSGKIQQD